MKRRIIIQIFVMFMVFPFLIMLGQINTIRDSFNEIREESYLK